MKKKLINLVLVLLLLVGVGLLLYPTFSDYWNSFHQSRAIASYAESVTNIDTAFYEELWTAAGAYNETLVGKSNPWYLNAEEKQTYSGLLDVSGSGIMGYINIPAINCSLPIYHGTDEAVLQIAVGHIEGSSLPIGGPSTHSVLSGHRGLPSAKLFTDLDKVNEGDLFMIQVLNETMTYEVDQIHTVLPNELDDLYIQEGRDFCTLVTCTPYGVNSHRLLVRGHRVANQEIAAAVRVTAEAVRIDPVIVAPVAAVPMLLVLMLWTLTKPSGSPKKKKPAKKGAKGWKPPSKPPKTPSKPTQPETPSQASSTLSGTMERQESDHENET